MRTHNEDLRQRIVAARQKGHSAAELARLFGISKRSIERFWKQHQATGSVKPKQRGGYRLSGLAAHDAQLRAWIDGQADLTLSELQARLQKELGIALRITALWHRLERLALSYKKNAVRRGARAARH